MGPLDHDISSIDAALKSLNELREQLVESPLHAREKMIDQARKLVDALQTPSETVAWIIYAEPARGVATRIAIDLKLFDTLAASQGRPQSVHDLAQPTQASPILVDRITRCLAAFHMIEVAGPSMYLPNRLTEAIAKPKYYGGVQFSHDATSLPFLKMPEFLRQTNYANPVGADHGPWNFAHDQPIFAWLGERPELLQAFHTYMYGVQEDRPYWTDKDFYPIQERLVDKIDGDGDALAFVDVGGGTGQSLQMFESRVSNWPGRLVLQELPPVVEIAKTLTTNKRIELMVHDFFTEQPVKGARTYFLRSILHDWSDEDCHRILQRLKEAAKPGHTKILLNEYVIADQKPEWRHAAVDIYMMGLTGAQERTESQWRKLIESAGLVVSGIWSKGAGNESVIEVSV